MSVPSSKDTVTLSDALPMSSNPELTVVLTVLLDIFVAIGPQIGYVFQFLKIHRTRSSSGYSPLVSLIMLSSNTIRLYYYYGFHYRRALLYQALLTVLTHIALLHKLITVLSYARRLPNPFLAGLDRTAVGGGLDDEHAAPVNPKIRSPMSAPIPTPTTLSFGLPEEGPAPPQSQPRGLCAALFRFSNRVEDRFRLTNHFSFWVTYCFCATMGLIAVLLLFTFTDKNPTAVAFVGYLALCTEALLLVPQVLRNANEGSAKGLSSILIFCWVAGDVLKLVYFIVLKQPMPFLVCTIFQLFVDFVLLSQVFYFNRQRRAVVDDVLPPSVNDPTPHIAL